MSVTSFDLPDFAASVNPGGSKVLALNTSVPGNTQLKTAVLNVSGLSQLLVGIGATTGTGQGQVNVQWFQDAAGLVPLNFQQAWSKNTQTRTRVVMAVQGPYVQLAYTNQTALAATVNIQIEGSFGGYRLTPAELDGAYVLLDQQATNLGAGAIVVPSTMRPGKAKVYLQSNSIANMVVGFQYWTGVSWDLFAAFQTGAVSAPLVADVNLPIADWEVQVFNASAVTYVVVTAEN